MKIVLVATVLLGYCASLNNAGMYHYNKQPGGPPPSHPQYLPNYDVPPVQNYEPVKYNSWENVPWKPITNFPWPGPEHVQEVYYPPHYHAGSTTPCPYKMHHVTKVTTTTTHKPTTTTTTTTHRPVETKKPHLLEKLPNTHKHNAH
ncbi:uncharacterized protein LOC125764564 [Anopheles funestus]|uniref:uncharacterized protein LOC125764564 n=1 Tax=Anopheles funestus TaxID=62324 RepID=UPI0020C6A4C3|nr:uncharacterized protein LOC125764564 [Anopheles funestus]